MRWCIALVVAAATLIGKGNGTKCQKLMGRRCCGISFLINGFSVDVLVVAGARPMQRFNVFSQLPAAEMGNGKTAWCAECPLHDGNLMKPMPCVCVPEYHRLVELGSELKQHCEGEASPCQATVGQPCCALFPGEMAIINTTRHSPFTTTTLY